MTRFLAWLRGGGVRFALPYDPDFVRLVYAHPLFLSPLGAWVLRRAMKGA